MRTEDGGKIGPADSPSLTALDSFALLALAYVVPKAEQATESGMVPKNIGKLC